MKRSLSFSSPPEIKKTKKTDHFATEHEGTKNKLFFRTQPTQHTVQQKKHPSE